MPPRPAAAHAAPPARGARPACARRGSDRSFTLLQIAAGVGLLPVVLHGTVDFALHMPGNAVWFAALAGVMLHPGAPDRAGGGAGGGPA